MEQSDQVADGQLRAGSRLAASGVIRAAGGIVWRWDEHAGLKLALVHRVVQDDWVFPKGKLKAGETEQDAALREVAEETGLRCRIGDYVARVYVRDRRRRLKTVSYWTMRALPGAPAADPKAEVDGLRWLSPEAALAQLTHGRDQRLLRNLIRAGALRFRAHAGDSGSGTPSTLVDRPPAAGGLEL